jgi:hypothetical protein
MRPAGVPDIDPVLLVRLYQELIQPRNAPQAMAAGTTTHPGQELVAAAGAVVVLSEPVPEPRPRRRHRRTAATPTTEAAGGDYRFCGTVAAWLNRRDIGDRMPSWVTMVETQIAFRCMWW